MRRYGSCAALMSLIMTCLSPVHGRQAQNPWLELKAAQFTVWYRTGYDEDAEFVGLWLLRAEALMTEKYSVTSTGRHVDFYLHSEPMQYANVGRATNICCTGTIATIHYLAPSAPAWKATARR
jgi:hypothetical protein